MALHSTTSITGRTRARALGRTRLSYASSGRTDAGLERGENEDRFLIAPFGARARRGCLLAVADGVGGSIGGALASSMTVESLEHDSLPAFEHAVARHPKPETITAALRGAFEAADHKVHAAMRERPELNGMATTLTAAACFGRSMVVANVGDSRCYLLRGSQLRRLTRDHTVPEEMVKLRLILPEAAQHHPMRNVLTSYVGGIEARLRVEVMEHDLVPGDVLLLCTDGLTDMVPEESIRAVLAATREPDRACERLVSLANEMGGHDNVTAVVTRVGDQEEEESS
jgi:protein phosphatase